MYKITIFDDEIKIYQYLKEKNKYMDTIELNINDIELDKLFYTIAVNYSQHSLNSLYIGHWIHSLFHKNDSYQTPIVIEPYRKDGNININRQEALIKQRLITNLLLQEDFDSKESSPRQLTEYYKAKFLKITFDINKIFYLTEKKKQLVGKHIFKDEDKDYSINYIKFKDTHVHILDKLFSIYKIEKIEKMDFYSDFSSFSFKQKIYLYILKKLISISYRYKKYEQFFDKENQEFKNFDDYINTLYKDKSHIVYKLKQAINFIRFEYIIERKENKEIKTKSIIERKENEQIINIEELSNEIENIKRINKEEKLIINELVLPSFFDIDIILDNNINFNSLSSGEKQKIYSVNSILYHINNINSVDNSLIQYKRVNIVLDEIELYFHPELQRNYLNYLLHVLSKANTNNILAVNILFVTHSPFILSDIPDSKILFLDKDSNDIKSKTVSSRKEIKTFGANIHTLLSHGFFMQNGLMGEFAKQRLEKILKYLIKEIDGIDLSQEEIKYTIDLIGEELLKNKLENLYNEFYGIETKEEQYLKRIAELEAQLERKR